MRLTRLVSLTLLAGLAVGAASTGGASPPPCPPGCDSCPTGVGLGIGASVGAALSLDGWRIRPQAAAPRRAVSNTPHPAVVRLVNSSYPWWGTHVGEGLIVTCAHAYKGRETMLTSVRHPQSGSEQPATVCAIDHEKDVAILRIADPAGIGTMTIPTKSLSGGSLTLCGRSIPYTNERTVEGDWIFRGYGIPGESGQPIYQGDTLVSFLSASSDPPDGTFLGPFARTISRMVETCRRGGRNPPVVPPVIPPITPPATSGLDELRAEIAELRELILNLEIQQGPPGDRGIPGQDGQDGTDGMDGARGLPGVVDYKKIPPITLLFDFKGQPLVPIGPDGPLSAFDVRPGATLRFHLVETE